MVEDQKYTCPCCGFLVFDEPPGSYVICDYCGWEDNPVQLANPCRSGGANRESLCDAQNAFRETTPGADIRELIAEGAVRDGAWRPLNNVEKEFFTTTLRNREPGANVAIYDLKLAYWNRNVISEGHGH